ncbi:tRNA(Ile)-lysidine synthase [Candidatus Arsenophonus lipoptenae]|uniref:tRNA(Ile)-lysidine synthase n=1 Tax=Candidatus Arsenophonus lipoptenae TaxID=634113 RepID=A0A0X9VQL8_9GAMM|nr:tRNA lysidine(34) synthetase TilS [Candidatus Arsenophonus lipoptenae]AMA64607.1 tRNA(Ile)-lysidine synthase [Candidatus Arsenophonus lipoptenae]
MTHINESVILNQITKIIGSNLKILVAFSGGLDSTVLLHALTVLRNTTIPNLNIRAAYINHGLNNKSNSWGVHCKHICLNLKVAFCSYDIHIYKSKKGIEAAARDARYKTLRRILLQNEIIVTAQHLNDQAETFLLALKRGSGPAGLSAMPVSIEFGHTYLVRPLLLFSRQELTMYAQKNNLTWIDDDSNYNQIYDRNFLRLTIMPCFNIRWPYFLKSVARSANLCAEQEKLVNELLEDYLSKLLTTDGSLKLDPLVEFSEKKRNAILRSWFRLYKILMPTRVQLKQIWQDVICARSDAEPKFILADNVIRRYKKELWLLPKFNDITKICLQWHLSKKIKLPDNLGTLMITNVNHGKKIRAPLPNEEVTIRFGLKGNIKIIGHKYTKRSKKIWQELGIAPWLRNRIPLIYYNNELITAVDVFITDSARCIKDHAELSIKWTKNKRLF